jgi:outer membrane receptor protein involved in Fe transport
VTQSSPGHLLPIVTNDLHESNTSYRASLNYKPVADTLVYASVSRGFKAGSFTLVPAILASQLAPAVQESVRAYEIGAKTEFAEHRVQLSGATFYYDYTNKQISGRIIIPPFGALPTLVNVPKSRVYGAEIEATVMPVSGLRISGGIVYTNSDVLENPAHPYDSYGNVANFVGERFPITTVWQGVLDAEYRMPVSARMAAFVGSTVSGRTNSSTALGNSTSVPLGYPALEIDGYALLDLRAGVESSGGSWRAWLWGRNVTNKFYLIQEARQSDELMRVAGMPATYGVSFSYRY